MEQYNAWVAVQPSAVLPSPLLSASRFSVKRAVAQALETRTGHVFPELDAVRPYITDENTGKVNADRAAKAAAGPNALELELDRVLGADDCWHAYITLDVFMPGVENFLCPCGLLVGLTSWTRPKAPRTRWPPWFSGFPCCPTSSFSTRRANSPVTSSGVSPGC